MPSFKKPRPQNPSRLAGQKSAPELYTGYLGREDWTCRAMSSDELNLQFGWTLAQGCSWFELVTATNPILVNPKKACVPLLHQSRRDMAREK